MLTARHLFNERRYGTVTVAALASELKITKGNLWYHFNDKRSLLEALSREFIELDGKRRQLRPVEGKILESYVEFLMAFATEMREFRFLFRDQADYGEHSDIMLEQLPLIYDETHAQFSAFFRQMKANGLLNIDDDRIEGLSIHVTMVLRYNLEFARERGLSETYGSGMVYKTFAQHLSLFDDKLSEDAANYLHAVLTEPKNQQRLIRKYLSDSPAHHYSTSDLTR